MPGHVPTFLGWFLFQEHNVAQCPFEASGQKWASVLHHSVSTLEFRDFSEIMLDRSIFER